MPDPIDGQKTSVFRYSRGRAPGATPGSPFAATSCGTAGLLAVRVLRGQHDQLRVQIVGHRRRIAAPDGCAKTRRSSSGRLAARCRSETTSRQFFASLADSSAPARSEHRLDAAGRRSLWSCSWRAYATHFVHQHQTRPVLDKQLAQHVAGAGGLLVVVRDAPNVFLPPSWYASSPTACAPPCRPASDRVAGRDLVAPTGWRASPSTASSRPPRRAWTTTPTLGRHRAGEQVVERQHRVGLPPPKLVADAPPVRRPGQPGEPSDPTMEVCSPVSTSQRTGKGRRNIAWSPPTTPRRCRNSCRNSLLRGE